MVLLNFLFFLWLLIHLSICDEAYRCVLVNHLFIILTQFELFLLFFFNASYFITSIIDFGWRRNLASDTRLLKV